ncbi:MAG: sulfite exporter TauE/SafE family protein, partial [Candidatus Freyarchaeota archaeon]|nr:sulfite exporter TauE/SafE family protein [Candidatus Jordarchaeia archaeon]
MWEVILLWVVVGFLAQLIDGALGMAYGVSSTAALVTVGVYPALASASVHTAEIFTTVVSGSAHFKLGNVDRNMAVHLAVPGIIGGITGAYVCTSVSGKPLSVVVGFVLLAMGFMILYKFAFKTTVHFRIKKPSLKALVPLGYAAAFLDALGGGGWGPVATTTLVANNVKPNKAVGSVNFAEFFVTFSESITFLILIGWENFNWMIVLGLIIGGVICAPA